MSRAFTEGFDLITRFTGVELELIADAAHYHRLIRGVLPEARHSVWIATATLKDTRIEHNFCQYRSIVGLLAELAKKGCDVRILHSGHPSSAFQRSFEIFSPVIQMRCSERVHCKILLVDGYQLYLGSANMTGAGMGAKSDRRRNFEVGIFTRHLPLVGRVRDYYEDIWDQQVPISWEIQG